MKLCVVKSSYNVLKLLLIAVLSLGALNSSICSFDHDAEKTELSKEEQRSELEEEKLQEHTKYKWERLHTAQLTLYEYSRPLVFHALFKAACATSRFKDKPHYYILYCCLKIDLIN